MKDDERASTDRNPRNCSAVGESVDSEQALNGRFRPDVGRLGPGLRHFGCPDFV